MKVVLAGGSGFLGGALRRALTLDGHSVANLTRRATPRGEGDVAWMPDGTAGAWAKVIDGADAVVNLAGEGIADVRWTTARKQALVSSRLLPTRSLVAAITRASRPPQVMVSASGINYYGPRQDELVTESMPPADDFLARLCLEWEQEAEQASPVTRVVLLRSGLALHATGGALRRMLLPFRLGAGGPQGSGRQFVSWIHRDDWVKLVRWLLETERARGAFNVTAPEPVTNKEFARELGRALRRPAVIPVPAIALRVLFGEVAELLLTGQRVVPARALEMGFRFTFPLLRDALSDLLGKRAAPSVPSG